MGRVTSSNRSDSPTTKIHLDSSRHGPGQKGRMGLQRHPKTKKKGDKEVDKEEEDDKIDDLEMTVPQLTRGAKAIQLLKANKAVKNLELFSCLDRYSDMQMLQMRERMEDWTKRVKNGALSTRSIWTSYTH